MILNGKEYWSLGQIVHHFQIDRKTFYIWQQRGLVPLPIRLTKFCFYCRDDLEALLARGETVEGEDRFRTPEAAE